MNGAAVGRGLKRRPAALATATLPRARRSSYIVEAIVLLLATAQPWAFGGVDAWAELAFGFAVVVAAILSTFHDEAKGRGLSCGASLALAGLVVFGWAPSNDSRKA